ncbi:hypothetical protein Fcan01_17437 [Folsomia candida]|uniref:Uncharacterized protein n=1 Tax=Folsomia candida TaxID=158441 RepID=A0A226DRM3_FOLCA|nr:hypothetical protein Fcan01_17437 [Folsomia candida]
MSSIPLVIPNMDPSYFLFRGVCLPPKIKILLRVELTFTLVFHNAIMIFSLLIYIVNVTSSLHICLDDMASDNTGRRNATGSHVQNVAISKFEQFQIYFLKYKQLQIIAEIQNGILVYVYPVALLVAISLGSVLGYVLVVLNEDVPFSLVLQAGIVLVLLVGAAHKLIPLVANITGKSEDFLLFWGVQKSTSSLGRRKLKSLTNLRMKVGNFFAIKKSARTVFLWMLLDNIITLIMSV